jgi:aerobic-type carbon monoxide dehydrogenase small subunit (CoxS/CutS family)
MIMASAAMLDTNPEPTDQEIDVALKDNLCRCGAYARIRKAIHKAASSMA